MHRWLGVVVLLTTLVAGCGLTDPVILPAAPPVDCRGIPAQTCREVMDNARQNAGPGVGVLNIRATCTQAACTDREGNVRVDVRYSDGREDHYEMGWSGAVDGPGSGVGPAPIASLPVEPTCQGIPAQACWQQAFVGLPNGGMAPEAIDVRSIVVRCVKGPCTETSGDGDTTVTFADGSTSSGSWSYEGATASDDPGSD